VILVTGGSGFIGGSLLQRLSALQPGNVRGAFRKPPPHRPESVQIAVVGEINSQTDWQEALSGVEVIVHTAARVHVMRESSVRPLDEYRRVNTEGTLNLARQAAAAGVKRFVYLSSIKVNGERTQPDAPFRADDTPNPTDPYGVSKLETERGLLEVSKVTGLEIVIIRPVLVYGPGVGGNFRKMMQWIDKGIPLPFAAIQNRRSMVGIENLLDLIILSISHPAAANQIFLVSDGEDLSTPDLMRRTAAALRKPARLFSFPVWVMRLAAHMLGRGDLAQRLCDSLQVDIRKNRDLLGWTPPNGVEVGLGQLAAGMKRP